MPGLFATLECERGAVETLRKRFEATWLRTVTAVTAVGSIGAHAHPPRRALLRGRCQGELLALDGERLLYASADGVTGDTSGLLDMCQAPGAPPNPKPMPACGNIASLCAMHRRLTVQADPSGSFPLYYARIGDGVAVSSLLRPLAAVAGARPDELAIIEFLRTGYVHNGRTLVEGIHRILPGQRLECDAASGRCEIRETSTLWSAPSGPPPTVDDIWQLVRAPMEEVLRSGEHLALMLSAGWDSRTLLAASARESSRLVAYHHGDLESREARIVTEICAERGVRLRSEPLVPEMFEPDLLQEGFARSENVVFPHWHRAGHLLQSDATDCIAAGVFGEILGGHYGAPMVKTGGAKVGSFLSLLVRHQPRHGDVEGRAVDAALDTLAQRDLGIEWCVESDLVGSRPDRLDQLNQAILGDLERLHGRGVADFDRLVEAFISEHRGAHYINAQILSCRAWTDVALPLASPALLHSLTCLPLRDRIHNRFNQRLLKLADKPLLRFPLAATLVPAGAPLLVQEASRLVRKIGEYVASYGGRGRTRLRLGWADLTPVFQGRQLRDLVGGLRCPFWRKDRILTAVEQIAAQPDEQRLRAHPIFDMLGKILTVDWTLSA